MATLNITTPSRRAILAGTAALPALAVPSIAQAGADPIFAAIEQHKAAYLRDMECVGVRVDMVDSKPSPDFDAVALAAADAAQGNAREASDDAAFALTKIQPTTMAGVLALLQYVEAFNDGAFYLETESGGEECRSVPALWPEVTDDEGTGMFGFDLLVNVRRTLVAMAA